MNLTVVIRCGDDPRVFRCIDSIDEDVEIIVSTSENEDFESELKEKNINYCLSPRNNLSITSNVGFNSASNEKVIITDSDTIFEKGCIHKINEKLDEYKVVRAKLNFLQDRFKPFSRLVAETRDYVNALPLVFTPGIGIRKELLPEIGGFLFNDPVPYAVDADLNFRVKNAKIPVCFLKDAIIYHDIENIFHDLKAAYRIGQGSRISIRELRKFFHEINIPFNALKAVKDMDLFKIFFSKGFDVGFYQIIWDLFYWIGYFKEKLQE